MLYCYLKTSPKIRRESHFRFLPFSLIILGTFFLGNAFFPIFLYQLKSFRFSRPVLIVPVESSYNFYDDYKNWFLSAPKLPPRPSKITHYNLSVPKLKIEKAVVQIGGEDLAESLIQYPGTALPGEYGNTVIFGHSVLPQFFNPKNYKTIFSTLPTLEEGDEILIDFDGIQYRYRVVKMVEVSPDDVSVLEQRYDSEYLSLVTCVPPGTYLKRLIVRAKLVNTN
ncbi:MAG: sortase [Microgenomates group bacterium]